MSKKKEFNPEEFKKALEKIGMMEYIKQHKSFQEPGSFSGMFLLYPPLWFGFFWWKFKKILRGEK